MFTVVAFESEMLLLCLLLASGAKGALKMSAQT